MTNTTATTKALTKAQAIAALTKAGAPMTKAELDAMPVAALRALVPVYAPAQTGTAGPDLRAEISAAMPSMTSEVLAAMPDSAIADLHARVCGTSTKGKTADLPKEPPVKLPLVPLTSEGMHPAHKRICAALRTLKAGQFSLPKLTGTGKTGTWQASTTWNVIAESLVDNGFEPLDAKVWADLASTGRVDAQIIVDALRTPRLEDRKGGRK